MLADDELKKNYEELGLINERQEMRVRHVETETTKIVISYTFLQATICLTSNILILISSLDHIPASDCKSNWWVPLSLSLLIAVLFWIPFAAKIHEWKRASEEFDWNLAARELMYYRIMSSSRRKRDGQMNVVDGLDSEELVCKPDEVKLYKRNAFIYVMTLALLAYTLAILTVCARSRTLCHSEA